MKRLSTLLAALALAAFGLAACGGDDDDGDTTAADATTEATAPAETQAAGGSGGEATVSLSSPPDGSFAYEPTELTASAGSVTVNYDNPAPLSHDVNIEGDDGTVLGSTDLVSEDSTSTTVDLQPGTYTYFCSVPGHRGGGMEGTLTVE